MSDDGEVPRASIRKGGESDGEQYYVISVEDMTGDYGSVALPEEAAKEYAQAIQEVVSGEAEFETVAKE